VLLVGCYSTSSLNEFNLANLYKPVANINPKFAVFNKTDSTSTIHYRINTVNLLYSKKESHEYFKAKARIKYKVFYSYESETPIDSGSIAVVDSTLEIQSKLIYGEIVIRADTGKNYVVKIESKDLYRKAHHLNFLEIYKTGEIENQDFILLDRKSNLPLFRNYLTENDTAIILSRHTNTKMFAKSYVRNFRLAPPPFTIYNARPFNFNPDTTYMIQFDSSVYEIDLPAIGFYQFCLANNSKEGFTLYYYNTDFPKVRSADLMIEASRYITSKREYERLVTSAYKKKAIDEFWLKSAASPVRARELIKQYYKRVQKSNDYFTSYKEGWRTDRGMTYIIFGPPNLIFKTSSAEVWTYGEQNNFMSMSFNFIKVINPFTDNDYSLDRSPIFKTNWYKSVDSWRQGRVFMIN